MARVEPRKKPRSAWRRFVYPAPNACWQLDSTEYVLTGGRTCVIFQLIDDHSRYAVALPCRLGRDRRGRDCRGGQGHCCSRGAPTTLVRQRSCTEPVAARAQRPTRCACVAPGRGGDHRQALQAHHPRQERTLPPDPVPLPRQTVIGRHTRATASPGRRVRPHLQHRTPPPRAPRACHTTDRVGSDTEGRSTPPQTRPATVRPARATPADYTTSAVGPARPAPASEP